MNLGQHKISVYCFYFTRNVDRVMFEKVFHIQVKLAQEVLTA